MNPKSLERPLFVVKCPLLLPVSNRNYRL